MKSTTMLSQITTQEDVLFAGITVKQLVIWMMGGIVMTAIYFVFPQPMKLNLAKGAPMLLVAVVTAISTIRYKSTLLLDCWLLKAQYLLRPTVITE